MLHKDRKLVKRQPTTQKNSRNVTENLLHNFKKERAVVDNPVKGGLFHGAEGKIKGKFYEALNTTMASREQKQKQAPEKVIAV